MSNGVEPLPTLENEELMIGVADQDQIAAIWTCPPDPRFVLLLAHGAGAGMEHRFMEALVAELWSRNVATLRYQFPYMQQGKKRPDRAPVLEATVRIAAARARERAGSLPLFAGGKSMGGRMSSRAQASRALPGVRGLVFFGFPLHPAGKPGCERADHLGAIQIPMLFVQGTRDKLADLSLLEPVCKRLGTRAQLTIIDGADHGFAVLKRSGRTDHQVLAQLADTATSFFAAQSDTGGVHTTSSRVPKPE